VNIEFDMIGKYIAKLIKSSRDWIAPKF
jgi:riboflavin synthase alpha subunit